MAGGDGLFEFATYKIKHLGINVACLGLVFNMKKGFVPDIDPRPIMVTSLMRPPLLLWMMNSLLRVQGCFSFFPVGHVAQSGTTCASCYSPVDSHKAIGLLAKMPGCV